MKSTIAIDGIDGSGKSTFARRLRAELDAKGVTSIIVSIDDFRRPVRWDELTEPEIDVYYDRYYDLGMAEHCLRAFLASERQLTIPNYDIMTEQIAGTRDLVFADVQIAIIEGVFPLRVPAVREGLHVYLDVNPDTARERIVARDIKKNRTRAETERRIGRRYFPAQERYHTAFTPQQRADIVIDNNDPTARRMRRAELSRAPEQVRAALESVLQSHA